MIKKSFSANDQKIVYSILAGLATTAVEVFWRGMPWPFRSFAALSLHDAAAAASSQPLAALSMPVAPAFGQRRDRGEGSEADQLLTFERLYLQVSAFVSQRINR